VKDKRGQGLNTNFQEKKTLNIKKKKRYRKLSRAIQEKQEKFLTYPIDEQHKSEPVQQDFNQSSVFTVEQEESQTQVFSPTSETIRSSKVSSTIGQVLVERHEAQRKEKNRKRSQQKKRNRKFYEEASKQEESSQDVKEAVHKKQKKEQVRKAARQEGRLSFMDETPTDKKMILGASGSVVSRASSTVSNTSSAIVHTKVNEVEEDNSAVQGIHQAENAVVKAGNVHSKIRQESKRSRLQNRCVDNFARIPTKESQKVDISAKHHAMQKQRMKREYQKAVYQASRETSKMNAAKNKTAETIASQSQKVKRTVQSFFKQKKGNLVTLGVFLLVLILLIVELGSCATMIEGVAKPIVSTTYASTDEEIYAVDDAYSELETALNEQINNMESTHQGYDEYNYQVDEISHNPYQLISYFTAIYGEFTYKQVKEELEEIFKAQYSLSVDSIQDTVTETKTVKVGESLGQVVTSGYCNCSICCGKWAGGATASGTYPTANHTLAVDATNPFVPLGTKIIMNGVEYVVEDTGAFDKYGVQFDVYYSDHTSATSHGHQTCEAYIADSNGSKEVEVTTTQEVNRLNVTLTNHGLDTILRSRMTEEQIQRYDLYNSTYGNRSYIFDIDSLPSSSSGSTYEVPSEALSDQKFANMIREAEKYLGYPYVWGGSSPSTSFDCSGFVSWVINNCGNGWNVGRLTANGLLGICTIVSESEAQPGDLIFFQGTYNTSGASHVGIYVGNNMMIHCGNPIEYASINSKYWKNHFYHFGRLP
jgi:cell wall-associated NlpC family hydrolase